MRLAFISDLHSNMYYFQQVLARISREAVDEIYCLGDLTGYYDAPHEVIRTCRTYGIRAVRGNHEQYILGLMEYDPAKEELYRIKEQRAELFMEDISYLKSLPESIELSVAGKRLYLSHSLPGDCAGYLHDLQQLDRAFLSDYDYFCYGHTHRPLISYHFGCCIVNPGSIGQPRDYTRKPSCIIADLAHDTIHLIKLDVDSTSYGSILRERGYPELTLKALERRSNEKN